MNKIEDQAKYYNNLPLRDRSIKAVVHLEDSDDILFWDNQLQNAFPATYHYITYSKNNNGTDTRGCEQCLRYKPYLTKRFFICIDSDLRQLEEKKDLLQITKLLKRMHILGRIISVKHIIFKIDLQHWFKTRILILTYFSKTFLQLSMLHFSTWCIIAKILTLTNSGIFPSSICVCLSSQSERNWQIMEKHT